MTKTRSILPLGSMLALATGCATSGGAYAPGYSAAEVVFAPGAETPWPGLEPALEVMTEVLESEYPGRGRELSDVRIDVVPSSGICRSVYVPTGMAPCLADPKAQCPVNGTIEKVPGPLALSFRRRICVRQLHDAQGMLQPAVGSALFHEMLEHSATWEVLGDLNWNHAEKYKRATAKAEALYYARVHGPAVAGARE